MHVKPLPDEFWMVYDVARERAESDPVWNQCEMDKQFAIDQSNIPNEYEEMVFNAKEHQTVMIIYELYQILIREKPMR